MFKRSSLFLLCSSPIVFALACGSSNKQHEPTSTTEAVTAPAEYEPAAEMPAEEMPAEEAPEMGEDLAGDMEDAEAASDELMGAHAVLMSTAKKPKELGTLEFSTSDGSVTISGSFQDLPKGARSRAVKILDATACDALSPKTGDFNPTGAKHGHLDSSERHVGDLGNIQIDKAGAAQFELTTDSLTIQPDSASSVLGQVIVVTQNNDDGKSQPDGRAGKAIACGKIENKPGA